MSFIPAVPGEWDATLVLHFVERTQGQTVIITRRLHGVATFQREKPRPEQLPGTKTGGRTRHSRSGSNKPTNLKQHAVQVINRFPSIPVPGLISCGHIASLMEIGLFPFYLDGARSSSAVNLAFPSQGPRVTD